MQLKQRESAALPRHIAGFLVGALTAEAVQIQGAARLEMEAFEAVAGLQAGVLRGYNLEAMLPKIPERNYAVRKPAGLDEGAGGEVVGKDAIGRELFRFAGRGFLQMGAEAFPGGKAYVLRKDVEGADGDGAGLPGGIAPHTLQGTFRDMFTDLGFNGAN